MKTHGQSGLKLWRARVRDVYDSAEELRAYDKFYSIARRAGFPSCAALWAANPILQGSTDPADFGVAA